MRKRKSRLPYIYVGLITIIMYLPVIVAVVYSFNESKTSSVWTGFTLKWYEAVFADRAMGPAVLNSMLIGLISTVLSAIIAVAAALAFRKRNLRCDRLIKTVEMIPLMIPEVILGVAYLAFFSLLNIPFGMVTLILGHMSFCIPYIFLQIETKVALMDPHPTEAARVTGAGPVTAFRDVTLPYLAPAVLSGMFLSFAMSLDDVIISMFVTGVTVNTLALKIYSQVKTSLTPKVNAICTLILAGMLLCLFLAGKFSRIKNHIDDQLEEKTK